MIEIERIEQNLLRTRKTLRQVCNELNVDLPNPEDLLVSQCTQCDVWAKNYTLVEDEDGNEICQLCFQLTGG